MVPDFDAIILDQHDNPVKVQDTSVPADENGQRPLVTMTLRFAITSALLLPVHTDQQLPPQQLMNLGALGLTLSKGDGHDLDAEQVALVKRRSALLWGALIGARVAQLLDPVAGTRIIPEPEVPNAV